MRGSGRRREVTLAQDSEPDIGELLPPEPEWETTPAPRPRAGMMGRRRRRVAMAFTLLALGTLVTPLIGTTPKVLGQSHWSPLQLVTAMTSGTLPLQHVPAPQLNIAIEVLLGPGIVYLLLIAMAVALLVFPSARFVQVGAVAGCVTLYFDLKYHYAALQEAIFGAPRAFASGHVNGAAFDLTLGGLMVMVFLIALAKDQEWEYQRRSQ